MENIQVHINEAAIIEQQLHEKELIIEKLKSKIQEISATLECEQKLRQAAEQRVKNWKKWLLPREGAEPRLKWKQQEQKLLNILNSRRMAFAKNRRL